MDCICGCPRALRAAQRPADTYLWSRSGAVEAELGECGLLPDELDVVLHLLACVNGGIEESRLAYSVGFDLLKVCWVLDALEPIVIRAAGMLILMEEVRAAIGTRSIQTPTACLCWFFNKAGVCMDCRSFWT